MKLFWRSHQLLQAETERIEIKTFLSGFGWFSLFLCFVLSLAGSFWFASTSSPKQILRRCQHQPPAGCLVQTEFMGKAVHRENMPLRLIEKVEVRSEKHRRYNQQASFEVLLIAGKTSLTFFSGREENEAKLEAEKIRQFLKQPESPALLETTTTDIEQFVIICLFFMPFFAIPVFLLMAILIVMRDLPDSTGFQLFPKSHYCLNFRSGQLVVKNKNINLKYDLNLMQGIFAEKHPKRLRLYLDLSFEYRYLDLNLPPLEQDRLLMILAPWLQSEKQMSLKCDPV